MQTETVQRHRSIGPTKSLDSGLRGDFEDPKKRGILQNTSCRFYREQLLNRKQHNFLQGLMIFIGMVTVLFALWFYGLEQTDQENQLSLEELWLGVWGLLGFGDQLEETGVSTYAHHCRQQLDTKRIFRHIGKQVLNQEQALARLERVVQSKRQFKSVALLGPPGVGKSLTTTALKEQFPWSENVHSYSWTTDVPDLAHKFHMMRQFVDHLSNCGQNLLIIDNLTACDYGVVPIYNQLLEQREGDPRAAVNQTVLVVYVFSLETEHYWDQFELLQQELPVDTTIINFRLFCRNELLDCLQNELRLEQRYLDESTVNLVLKKALLDVETTGCKRIHNLLLQHGLFGP